MIGIFYSLIGIILFLFLGFFLILLVEAFATDDVFRGATIAGVLIFVPLIMGICHYSYWKQLRWMRESEEYLAKRMAERESKAQESQTSK